MISHVVPPGIHVLLKHLRPIFSFVEPRWSCDLQKLKVDGKEIVGAVEIMLQAAAGLVAFKTCVIFVYYFSEVSFLCRP